MPERTYVTKGGITFRLGVISPMAIKKIENMFRKTKPKVPTVEVLIPGSVDKTRMEPNPNDPVYISEVEEWEEEKNSAVMRYVFTVGIKNDPPEDFSKDHNEYFENDPIDPKDMKFMWVSSHLNSEEEMSGLMEAVMGQNMVTPAGMKEAENSFRSDGGRNADNGVEVQGPANGEHSVLAGHGGTSGESVGGTDTQGI